MELKVKIRESNFELLRLIAMIMVVVVHVDFGTLGWPTVADVQGSFCATSIRILIQSLCACCVDVFVLISGWFGIRPNAKKLAGFFFECVFFSIGLWLVSPLWGGGKDFRSQGIIPKPDMLGVLVRTSVFVLVYFVTSIKLLH